MDEIMSDEQPETLARPVYSLSIKPVRGGYHVTWIVAGNGPTVGHTEAVCTSLSEVTALLAELFIPADA